MLKMVNKCVHDSIYLLRMMDFLGRLGSGMSPWAVVQPWDSLGTLAQRGTSFLARLAAALVEHFLLLNLLHCWPCFVSAFHGQL